MTYDPRSAAATIANLLTTAQVDHMLMDARDTLAWALGEQSRDRVWSGPLDSSEVLDAHDAVECWAAAAAEHARRARMAGGQP